MSANSSSDTLRKQIHVYHKEHQATMSSMGISPFENTIALDLFRWAARFNHWKFDSKILDDYDISPLIIDSLESLNEPIDAIENLLVQTKTFSVSALERVSTRIHYIESIPLLAKFDGYRTSKNKGKGTRFILDSLKSKKIRDQYMTLANFSNNHKAYFANHKNEFKNILFSRSIPESDLFEAAESASYLLAKKQFGEDLADKYFKDI